MFFTLNQFLQRVWYAQKVEVRSATANGGIVLAGENFMMQRNPNYRKYENFYIVGVGADDGKLIITL